MEIDIDIRNDSHTFVHSNSAARGSVVVGEVGKHTVCRKRINIYPVTCYGALASINRGFRCT